MDWRASVGSAFTFAVRVFAPGFSFGGCSPAGFSVRVSVPFGGGRSLGVVRGVCSLFFVAGFRRGLVAWFLCALWVVVSRFSFCVLLLV